ncbi:hypothetical protein F4861DRAFT_544155 [Xylaria intraflava]|nr:hypothetical protein F4861DRAFT_544155 [Xylaria intraflava]
MDSIPSSYSSSSGNPALFDVAVTNAALQHQRRQQLLQQQQQQEQQQQEQQQQQQSQQPSRQSPDTLSPDEPVLPPLPPTPSTRQLQVTSERAKRKVRKRGPPAKEDATATLVAEADEQAIRRQRVIRWEHFLFGEQKDPRTQLVLSKIFRAVVDPDSKVYDEERRAVLALHRRFQTETLSNCLKLCNQMIQGDSETGPGPWAALGDPRVNFSDELMMETIQTAWSWQRFYVVWHWPRQFVDGEASQPLAQYYCQQIWQMNVLETIRYIRIKRKNPDEAANAQKTRIITYVSIPAHPNFVDVKRSLFVERSPAVKGPRGSKKQRIDPTLALAHMKIPPPPSTGVQPGAEVDDNDDDEEGYD